ncbi:MAG: DUF2278 family protein [Pseudonocardiales bacterium]
MPLSDYGVLVGRVLESRSEGGTDSPHFQIRVRGGSTDFRVAVNVLSQLSPSELLYVADEAFGHRLRPPVRLGNQGGMVTLLNPAGLKVDGVAYTEQQAEAEGWTIVF